MINYEKLDDAINELEKQSSDLKEFNKVYEEIISIIKSDIVNNLNETNEKNKEITEIVKKVEHHLDSTKIKIDEIYENNKYFQKELDSSIFSRLEKHKSDIQVEIRDSGINIQRSLETSLISKITESDKSTVILVEDTRTIFKNQLDEIESIFKNEFIKQKKQSKKIIFLSSVLLAVSIGIAIAIYIIR